MTDEGPNLGDYDPSWMTDGGGISGEQGDPDFSDDSQWDTNAWSRDLQDSPGGAAGGGITVQTGPFSGGYLGTVNGVTTITLDERYFLIQDNGGGEVLIGLNTTECP